MRSPDADGRTRLLHWRRVREFAVPPSMIHTATARRLAGDWAAACAAAHIDVDLDLRTVARTRGRDLAALIRTDLRRLAPDLLRWHLPRTIPNGLLRPGLTISLTRYPHPAGDVHLVARTAPGWADAGQRISLALWDPTAGPGGPHPRPRPDRRFRLDLHPHLWAADRAPDLLTRSGALDLLTVSGHPDPSTGFGAPELPVGFGAPDIPTGFGAPDVPTGFSAPELPAGSGAPESPVGPGASGLPTRSGAPGLLAEPCERERLLPAEVTAGSGYAVHRWIAEAAILREADRVAGPVTVRLGNRQRLRLDENGHGTLLRGTRGGTGDPVLPYAATWIPPDLELLHAGMISADQLHPLVAQALTTHPLAVRARPPHPLAVQAPPPHPLAVQARPPHPLAVQARPPHPLAVQARPQDPPAVRGQPPRLPARSRQDRETPNYSMPNYSAANCSGTNCSAAHHRHRDRPSAEHQSADDRSDDDRGPDRPETAVTEAIGGDVLWVVECCGATHRVGRVGGVLVPLDHDEAELSRESLLTALGGPPLPCLRAIEAAVRNPANLDEIRARLDHGDDEGAAALVTELLGPDAEPEGALGELFTEATEGRIGHGLYRAGLADPAPVWATGPIGPRMDRAGRRGRRHRLPKRTVTPR